MKLLVEMSADKLRGGYYTPRFLVEECYERLASLIGAVQKLSILEPSAGDGGFVRFMPKGLPWPRKRMNFQCIELHDAEAQKCAAAIEASGVSGEVACESFFEWAIANDEMFRAVVGNPPFLRYQFVPKADRTDAETLMERLGQTLDGVSNLWIAFVLISLSRIVEGGAFAFVLPSELFSIKSAGAVREVFVRYFDDVTLDLYPRDSFPEILQDVIVVSGRRSGTADSRKVTITDHAGTGKRSWVHTIPASQISWTRYLLTTEEHDAFLSVGSQPFFKTLKEVATLGVSIVTGANDYFTIDEATVKQYQLRRWTRPMMPKTADCMGLVFEESDHQKIIDAGRRAWLLDFSEAKPDPMGFLLPAEYIRLGEQRELHLRFKCRIREPWYRVPGITSGTLMMTKRSHQFHRLLLNRTGVFTTDTVYRGEIRPAFAKHVNDLVAGFHNSASLLSAEIEGRNYGGGVLELVPSEVQRVIVPILPMAKHLKSLDQLSRDSDGQLDKDDRLIEYTNSLLLASRPQLADAFGPIEVARQRLRLWRFER